MKKIAVITGASSGMGRRFAETVQEFGTYDEIWAIARRVDRLEELKNHTAFPVRTISLDLSDRRRMRRMPPSCARSSRRSAFSSTPAASANSAP